MDRFTRFGLYAGSILFGYVVMNLYMQSYSFFGLSGLVLAWVLVLVRVSYLSSKLKERGKVEV